MRKRVTLTCLSILIVGCELKQRPSYAPLENTLPPGGPTIQYDPDSSFKNIDKISATLSDEDSKKFGRSLGWYGTESDFSLEKIDGKTARQSVEIVNCLKQAETKEQQAGCFN
ncbi:hypothetical protein [Motiliproteus sp. MSK22-1]|uniref:hypothetical protein n=1 Tax=Motiliproteus sp. MSK22-1 TaxID=1897630 RepID=UPI00097690CE|nr:hypothetical protein [Motiliproteus sp. MSK22-1]OMH39406.1 hypothetical protein BGP75_03610 [Motiliproteus sp. MSK22-1]